MPLAAALRRNVTPEGGGWPEAEELAGYALQAARVLATQAAEEILAGRIVFPTTGPITGAQQ